MAHYLKNMEKVYLNLGYYPFNSPPDTEIINAHGMYHDCDSCEKSKEECDITCLNNAHPTLKDIGIIMETMVGQGVIWQLANELSERLDVGPYQLSEALSDIFQEYAELPAQEAIDRFYNNKNLGREPENET